MLNFAFMKTWSPIVVVVSFPLQTRFISLRKSSCIDCPSAEPETMDHSPCILARSFLMDSGSWAQAETTVVVTTPMTKAVWKSFIIELLKSNHYGRGQARPEWRAL